MRVLLIHNQLWAHYKSKLFSEISANLMETAPESTFLVAHIALYEASRSVMQDDETVKYDYPYQVLFDTSLDKVGFSERMKALLHVFDTFKPTVLNVTGYFDNAQVLLMIYAQMKGVKVVLSSESSPLDHHRSPLKEKIKSWIVNRAHIFFCFGKSSADYLLSLGVREDQIPVRHAAVVDETLIRSNFELAKNAVAKPKKYQFVYVGRLAEEKNLELLVKAFLDLKKESIAQDWGLLFVGDGPTKTKLQQLSGNPDANDITFAGGHPWYKVPEWMAKADVLVLPSKSEPWGLVVNEAMICGMPVIVSEKCGCAEDLVISGQNGFVFNPEDQSDLEKAMRYFMEHPEKMTAMGVMSEQLIKPFSSKKIAGEMVKSYKNLHGSF